MLKVGPVQYEYDLVSKMPNTHACQKYNWTIMAVTLALANNNLKKKHELADCVAIHTSIIIFLFLMIEDWYSGR